MAAGSYRYHAGVLDALLGHGIAPRPTTEPAKVRELLAALYLFEVRELRERRRELEAVLGPQPLEPHSRRVTALRERYGLLGLPLALWVEGGQDESEGARGLGGVPG